jgi:outer membrane receptor protein involved in Fe transport
MVMGQASSAWGQAPAPPATPPTARDATPPPAAPPPAAQDAAPNDEILVVGSPSERSSIDRTAYYVRDTARARSSNIFDLLERIPSIEVTASGQLRLLGRSGVRILIDGNDVANAQTVLRNLQGSQVERIEVISNPSAQFSAQGTAGIVNIVLRRSFASGIGGSVTGNVGSYGAYDFKLSPTWSRGRFSVSGSLGLARGIAPTEFEIQRSTVDPNSGTATESLESGTKRNPTHALTGNLIATYRPTPSQSITVTATAMQLDGDSSSRSELLSSLDPANPLTLTSSGTADVTTRDLGIDYRRETARQGETLTFSAKRSTSHVLTESSYSTVSALADLGSFDSRSDSSVGITTARFDYVRPFDRQRRLSVGGSIRRQRDVLVSEVAGRPPLGPDLFSESSRIAGSWLEKAAYVTYQFPLLGGTVLAGLRVEDRSYDLDNQVTGRPLRGTNLFPSLHLERSLAQGVTGTLSYSRRIDWPGIIDLDPALRFSDSTTARAGNALLRPQLTDSFEAKLRAQLSGQSIELTAFSRRTGEYRSSLAELNDDGVLVIRSVNLGAQLSRGLNLVVQGPLGGGFSYALTGNLSDERIGRGGVAAADLVRASTQYGASAQIEFRDGTEGRRHSDHIEIRARYSGPTEFGLVSSSSFVTASATWSHAFTDRLSGVLTVTDFIGPPTVRVRFVSDTTISRQFDRAADPRVTFSLSFSLGPSRR